MFQHPPCIKYIYDHVQQVPAVVLVCRNSTDTAYFQRLRPYPRVMLRRHKCLFKDYDKTPIGFGVVVFCIAKSSCRSDTLLSLAKYARVSVMYFV